MVRIAHYLVAFAFIGSVSAQTPKEKWVDSVFNQMNVSDKIGQLFMITVPAGKMDLAEIEARIETDHIGGIYFARCRSTQQATLANRFQSKSGIPLLVGSDGNSLNPEQDSLLSFPPFLALGALSNDGLIYELGAELGSQLRSSGVHINFISANTYHPVTNSNSASFGDDRLRVASKSLAFVQGLESEGVLACAKFFPVHAITPVSNQKGVPSLVLSVDSAEVYPFKTLIRNQLPALLPASDELPLYYTKKKSALRKVFTGNSLSSAFAGGWVKNNLHFKGVIFSDVENLVRSSYKFGSGEAEVFAFQAGNDMLITSTEIGAAIRKMKKLFKKQKEFLPQLDQSVKRILALKYDAGLTKKQWIDLQSVPAKQETPDSKFLQQKVYQQSITVVKNDQDVLPVQSLDDKIFKVILTEYTTHKSLLVKFLAKYAPFSVVAFGEKSDPLKLDDPHQRKQVIVAALFADAAQSTVDKLVSFLKEPPANSEVIICDFGSSYFRKYAQDFKTVITGFAGDEEMQKLLPQVIFGGLPSGGTLPIAFGGVASGTTIRTGTLDRLTYSFPEDAGMDAATLRKIDAIANEAIALGATPGCQVLVARNGKVIYEKSFGYLTYEKQSPVTDDILYDLASVTKVSATLQTTMFLYERGLIDINKKASVYLPELRNSDKKDLIIKDILTHQSGLKSFIPFYVQTLKDSLPMPEYYNTMPSAQYPYAVADKMYASASLRDSLWTWVIRGKLREKIARTPYDYVYSDMSFYILQHLGERVLNQPLEDFVSQNLYEPLGAYTTGFLPLLRFPVSRIAPTENDKIFRRSLLIGTVHDPGAAMHGGVAGHAGLFSTANDLAKLYQMLLQGGRYGGIQYYKPETVNLFTQKQYVPSRRGLGWDKPTGDWKGSTGLLASPKTFGHTGYTGTCVWADPEFNLLYIFLSNRVHPVVTNKLLTANIRSRIQDVIYQSIFEYCKAADESPVLSNAQADASGNTQ